MPVNPPRLPLGAYHSAASFMDRFRGFAMSTLTTPTPATAQSDGERIPPDSLLSPYISINPARMHGEPCFTGSRVPIKTLFDHLRAGDPLEVFLTDFPPVTRAQAAAVIDLASRGLLDGLRLL